MPQFPKHDDRLKILDRLHTLGTTATGNVMSSIARDIRTHPNGGPNWLNLCRRLDDEGVVEVTWNTQRRTDVKGIALTRAGLEILRIEANHVCTPTCIPTE